MAARIAGVPAAVLRYINAGLAVVGAVRYDVAQAFNSGQAAQLIKNIGQINPFQNVNYQPNMILPMGASCNLAVVLIGNMVMAAPTGAIPGLSYTVYLKQDGVGSRTVSWNGCFDWGAAGPPTLTSAPNKTDIISIICDGNNTFRASVIGKGFNY